MRDKKVAKEAIKIPITLNRNDDALMSSLKTLIYQMLQPEAKDRPSMDLVCKTLDFAFSK